MYEDLVAVLRHCGSLPCEGCPREVCKGAMANMSEAADAIEKLNKRIDFLMNCIYEAEDSLDRGADNDWARAALEKAERGHDNV